jgi:thiol-disulfide isomerase/thioredoxin
MTPPFSPASALQRAATQHIRMSSTSSTPSTSNIRIEYIGAAWCAPCKVVKPVVGEMAHRFGVPAVFLDYDEDLEEEQRDAVKKLPTIRVFGVGDSGMTEITTKHAEALEALLKEMPLRVSADEDF